MTVRDSAARRARKWLALRLQVLHTHARREATSKWVALRLQVSHTPTLPNHARSFRGPYERLAARAFRRRVAARGDFSTVWCRAFRRRFAAVRSCFFRI